MYAMQITTNSTATAAARYLVRLVSGLPFLFPPDREKDDMRQKTTGDFKK
jgi:hypothetical protein